MKLYPVIFCTLALMQLSAEIPHKYDDDVIVPKALKSSETLQETTAHEAILEELVETEENQAIETNINNTNVTYPTESIDPDNVIIPQSLQSTQTAQQILGQRTQEAIPTPEPEIKEPPVKPFPNSTSKKMKNEKKDTCQAIQVPSNAVPNIEGVYTLNRGVERNVEIKQAALVIERLDVDDFGYYYVTQMGTYSPSSYYGIFHYDQEKKKFFHKTYETNTTTTLDDNIIIKYDQDQIETIVSINVGKRAIIWDKHSEMKDTSNLEIDESMRTTIAQAYNSYLEIYKKHPCFLE